MEISVQSISILLEDLKYIAIVRVKGFTKFLFKGNLIAVYDDYSVKGYSSEYGYGVKFIPKEADK